MTKRLAAAPDERAVERFPNMPDRIRRLPADRRGFPVPWFVAWIDGEPDFRVIRPGGVEAAHLGARCWICGERMGRMKTFVIGPMCAINRISSEPPSHPECARFAAQACPFLVNPRMRRNEKAIPSDTQEPPGVMERRNPGVALVWSTLRYSGLPQPGEGWLFNVGRPVRVDWMAEGRPATRAECWHSIVTGLPLLKELAADDGEARALMAERLVAARRLLPASERRA